MADTKWMLIGRGKVGWHADGLSDGNRTSGFGGTLEGYAAESADGTPVYDAIKADDEAFATWVVRGPLLDPSLEPGTIDKFGDHTTLVNMLPALGEAYQTLGILALTDKAAGKVLGSFDSLSLDLYLELFKASVSGVKWGQVQNGKVAWE